MNVTTGYDRGILSEQRIEEALNELINRRKLPYGLKKYRIERFVPTERYSKEDLNGVDFELHVTRKNHKTRVVPIQVKSGIASATNFLRHCIRLGKFIPIIVVNIGERIETLIKKLVAAIKAYLVYGSKYINRSMFDSGFSRRLIRAALHARGEGFDDWERLPAFVNIPRFKRDRQPALIF